MRCLRDAVEPLAARRSIRVVHEKARARIVADAVRDFWTLDYRRERAAGQWRVTLASPASVGIWGGQEKTHRKCYFATAKAALDFLLGELRGEGL